jgi:hypothetical protein
MVVEKEENRKKKTHLVFPTGKFHFQYISVQQKNLAE